MKVEEKMEEKDKNNQNQPIESNIARRERLLGTDMTDKIHDSEAEITKGSFFANLWYKHKWTIIIASVFILVAIVGIIQMINVKKYDVEVSYFGPNYVKNELYNDIQEVFGQLMDDYNGDGEKRLNFTFTVYQDNIEDTPDNQDLLDANTKNLESMNGQIASGNISFYIMDKSIYEMYKGHFITVEEILGYKLDENMLYDSRAALLSETLLEERYPTLAPICTDAVICVQKNYITTEAKLESAKALFKAIVELE